MANLTIVSLSRTQGADAIEVLAQAFAGDPLITYFLDRRNPAFADQLREFFHFSCEVRFDLGWPLLGCLIDNRLIGVVCLSEPTDRPWPDSLTQTYERLKTVIGPQAVQRLEAYARLTDAHRPRQPNLYLAVIGVHPSVQGQGVGRALMEAVHRLAESRPDVGGVALDTENPANVPYYQRLGYGLQAANSLDAITVWTLFRPNGES